MTQPEFSALLGKSLSTTIRYETTYAPRGKVLSKLASIAKDRGFDEFAQVFERALNDELQETMAPGPRTLVPRLRVKFDPESWTQEEREYVGALLIAFRNTICADDLTNAKKALHRPLMLFLGKIEDQEAGAFARQAITRLLDEGKTLDEIHALLVNIPPQLIEDVLKDPAAFRIETEGGSEGKS